MRPPNWPTREEWAKQHRTLYIDQYPDTSTDIADYATAEEIAALRVALRERWKELGRAMKYSAPVNYVDDIPYQRRCINRGLKAIDDGELPLDLEDRRGAEDILAPFIARQNAARDAEYKRAEERAAQAPIDDEAWARELKRRAEIEEFYRRSSRPCIHP